MGWSPVAALDRRVYPAPDRPDELEAAHLILEMHRSGCTRKLITQTLNASHQPGARGTKWHARLVASVIRRQGGGRQPGTKRHR